MDAGFKVTEETLADEAVLSTVLFDLRELEITVEWCIFHEGCPVYSVPPGERDEINDGMTPMADLRNCYMRVQAHNQHAQDVIRNANDELLRSVTLQVASAIPYTYQLRNAFWWVAYHEGKMVQFREWSARHNFTAIRREYHDMQNHNPNARNLLAAVNNRYIFDLVNGMLLLTKQAA